MLVRGVKRWARPSVAKEAGSGIGERERQRRDCEASAVDTAAREALETSCPTGVAGAPFGRAAASMYAARPGNCAMAFQADS